MKFNLILAGYGGQGVMSLVEIIGKAAMEEGYEVKSAEVHGLSQRGGSLQCHLRFGKKIFSPLVRKSGADLIISLELLEAWRACYYANKNTVILTEKKLLNPDPISQKIKPEHVLEKIEKVAKVEAINASDIVKKIAGETTMVNIFMLGVALKKNFLPLKKENVWGAISSKIRPQFLEINKKVFEEAFKL